MSKKSFLLHTYPSLGQDYIVIDEISLTITMKIVLNEQAGNGVTLFILENNP